MNILFLNEMMNSGSVSYYIREQTAIELAKKGNKVTMISPSLSSPSIGKSYSKNGIKYVFTPGLLPAKFRRGGFGILDLITKLIYVLFQNYNIIHATAGHRPSQFIPAVISKWLKKSKIIDEWWEWYDKEGRASTRVSIIGKIIGKYDDMFELRLKKPFQHVISISSHLQKRILNIGIARNKTSILFGAIDSNKFINHIKNDARDAVNIPKKNIVLGLIAVGEADHDDNKIFIESFLKLIKLYSNLQLFVTGEKEYINRTFGELIGTNVIYKGWLSFKQYNLHLSSCDSFILPLNPEPRNLGRWPHKFSEFVFLERPIITSKFGDQSKLVSKFQIGYCLDNNIDSYCLYIENLIKGSQITNEEGFKSLKSKFTISYRTNNLQNIYEELTAYNL